MTSKRKANRSFDGALSVTSGRNRVQREPKRKVKRDYTKEVQG